MKVPYHQLLLALGSGASLTLSFAPFRLWIFAYFSLATLILMIHYYVNTKRKAAIIGFFWGIGFFGTNVSWIFISIYRYGDPNIFIAGLITGIFILFLTIFPTWNLMLLQWLKQERANNWAFILSFASSWVLMEHFRGWFLTGFPWGLLGYTQLDSVIKYYASYLGIFGCSFLVAIIAGLLSRIIINFLEFKFNFEDRRAWLNLIIFKRSWVDWCIIISIFALGWCLDPATMFNQRIQKSINLPKVALIQGNIDLDDKFFNGSVEPLMSKIYDAYVKPTLKVLAASSQGLDLIIWPENSVSLDPNYSQISWLLSELDQLCNKHNCGLLLGIPIVAKGEDFYNSMLALGKIAGVYYKQHLVPFGEYIPFGNWLRGLIRFFDLPLSNFIPGNSKQPVLWLSREGKSHKVLATICYDIAYASKLRDRIRTADPELIVTISEDGWFGNSLGPDQHLDLARFRAIETGKYVLRSTNQGITAIIDYRGNVIQQAPRSVRTTLIGNYEYCSRATVWVILGNKPIIFSLWLILIIASFSTKCGFTNMGRFSLGYSRK